MGTYLAGSLSSQLYSLNTKVPILFQFDFAFEYAVVILRACVNTDLYTFDVTWTNEILFLSTSIDFPLVCIRT